MVAPTLGGELRRVGVTGRPQLDWMPDGAGILAIAESGKGEDVIALVDLDDASSQPLAIPNDKPHPVGHYSLSVSPDALRVAFVQTGGGPMELCVAPITGGTPQCLFEPPSGRIRGVDWSPDGSELVFAVDPGPWADQALRGLWRIPATGGEPVRVPGADGEVSEPSVSSDGKLAYRRELHDINIWRVDGPTAANPGATKTRVVDSTRIDQEPNVSPDGSRLAYASNRNGVNQIWVSDADGKNAVQLTFDEQTAQRPRWSPDGHWIVFEDFEESGNIHLAVIEASGGIPRKLTQSDEFADFLPSFSRDGRFVYFASNRYIPDAPPPFSVYRVPFDGAEPELVSRSNTNMVIPSLTQDEIFIYRRGEIWRDGDTRALVDKAQWPLWDVFEDGICYHRNAPGDPIECYRFSTGEIQPITDFGETYGRGLAVSPDGRWIYYTVDELDSSDIMMIEGLF